MTPFTNTAYVAETSPMDAAMEVAAAERLLRDVAFVLRLTRRVKTEMLADRLAEPHATTSRHAEGALVA